MTEETQPRAQDALPDAAAAEAVLRAMAAFPDALAGSLPPPPSPEAKYQALVDQMPAIVFMAYLDRPATEAFISPHIEAILGYTSREWLDDPVLWYYRIHTEDRPRWSSEAAGFFATGEPLRSIYRVTARDGRLVWLRFDVRLRRDERGQPWFVHGVAFDVSDIQQANEALQGRTNELQAAYKELESFSYSVAHDLRSPLRGVSTFANLLQRRWGAKLDAAGQDYLEHILKGARRMDALIEALLELARVARSELRAEEVDVGALAREAFEELRAQEPQRPVTAVIQAGLSAWGDRALLRIVLDNLVGNAWKFTRDAPRPVIEVGRTRRADQPVYYVRDNGVGFDMAFAGKLFKPFNRLHSAGEFPGSGIGLAIIDRIIRRHGGEAWAEGSVGQGATIYFSLPDPRGKR